MSARPCVRRGIATGAAASLAVNDIARSLRTTSMGNALL
jgi:hypothetical protein